MKRSLKGFFYVSAGLGALALIFFWRFHLGGSGPQRSFDEIRRRLEGKTAAETLSLLGEPDTRREVFGGDVRWIWWSCAILDGKDHPPELRGRVVHVQIVFRNPKRRGAAGSSADWRMDEGLGVGFWLPGETAKNSD